MTGRASTLLQAEDARLHLSLAGAWAAATRVRLGVARAATSTLEPATFEAFGVAMSTVLTFHLALFHVLAVTSRAPWIGSVPMDAEKLKHLYSRTVRFRDAFMHFGDKAERPVDFGPALTEPADPRLRVPRIAVTMGLGFEGGVAWLYAPIDKQTTQRGSARISWAEIEDAALSIEVWTRGLLEQWEPHVKVSTP